MDNCVFCNIANKVIEKELLFEDADVLAFYDLLPQAPVHIQIITKKHIASVNELGERSLSSFYYRQKN